MPVNFFSRPAPGAQRSVRATIAPFAPAFALLVAMGATLAGFAPGDPTTPAQSGAAQAEKVRGDVPKQEQKPAAAPARDRLLVFSKTGGFRHDSIPDGIACVKELLGERYEIDATEDSKAFTAANLARYKAVVFLSTTGDILNEEEQRAFQEFIHKGGGYAGVHAAADTEHTWPWYGELVGAYFKTHPNIQEALVRVEDRTHASTKMLPAEWRRRDEWYVYKTNPRGKVQVLANLDDSTIQGANMGGDHPIAWYHAFEGGRSWYTGGGHTKESYTEPLFREHLKGGILWAAGAPDATEPVGSVPAKPARTSGQ